MRNSVGASFLAPVDAEINERIAWLIQLRWLAVVGSLGTTTLANLILPGVLPLLRLAGIIASVGTYNIVFYVYAHALQSQTDPGRRLSRSIRLAHCQIALDLVFLTLILHFTGAAETPFWAFYVLHVIIASILLPRSAAFGYATLATTLYLTMVALEYYGVIPHVHLAGVVDAGRYQNTNYLMMVSFAFVTTLFFAALMATTIVARLRQRDQELVETNRQCDARAQELAALNRRLNEMDEMRKRFIMVVTHELRSPAAAIQSYLRLILGGYVPPEKQKEILLRAERRAIEQLDQINDLLVLGQIQERRLKSAEVDLGESLRRALDVLRGSAEEKKLGLNLLVEPDTPSIIADPDQICHLWMNLISNAIKYTPEGGSIEIAVSQRPASIMGSVKDTGIGISPQDQQRIFDEFYRSEEAKQMERHGTGLGLAIVKRIVEEYGGRIWVNSSPGKGSKFTFVLPKTQPPDEATGSEPVDASTLHEPLPEGGEPEAAPEHDRKA